MNQPLTRYLRKPGRNGFRPPALRLAAALALALFVPSAAWAYTVVLRGGRRVEIPQAFTVTREAIIYELSSDVRVALQMSAVDVEATERANNEPPGSLLRRIEQRQAQSVAPGGAASDAKARGQARRTLTNKDLEALRARREESEAAYERRRKELGLPSLEEARRRIAAEDRWLEAQSRSSVDERARNEAYWRARASELRAAIASLDAQVDYFRSQLADTSFAPAAGSYTVLTTVAPLFTGRAFAPRPSPVVGQAAVPGFPGRVRPGFGPQAFGRVHLGGGVTRGQVLINAAPRLNPLGQQFALPPAVLAPPPTLVGGTFPYYAPYPDYDRAALVERIRALESERAGLQARWRVLEDEARRAGVPPGWLRP
ncbi:MAG TPA: hypothetical protein VF507_06165 [Pyrinomonadaceae bacterium]|jgi:hypothetical protein